MEDSLSLLQIVPAVLLVLLGLLLVMMSRQRRRGGAAPTRSVAVSTGNSWVSEIDDDDDEPVADLVVTLPTEPPVAPAEPPVAPADDEDDEDDQDDDIDEETPSSTDTVRGLGRRPYGRHSAAPAPAVKRRRRPFDVGPQLGPAPAPDPAVEDVAVDAVPAVPEPPAPAEDPVTEPEHVPEPDPDHEHVYGADTEPEPEPELQPEPEPGADVGAGEGTATTEDIHTYRLRVDATIQAMSRRIEPTETPDLIEARLIAALDRLDVPAGFTRPMLSPAGPPRSGGELRAAPPYVPMALSAELPVEEVPVVPPVGAQSLGVEPVGAPPSAATAQPQAPQPDAPQPETPATDEPEVVLPVPPTASRNDAPRRGLRWRGKSS